MYKKPGKDHRNYDGVQHGEHRRKIEGPFNDMHDELSDCYYNKKPFRDYGLLDKETFDALHGLIFDELLVHFHEENTKNPKKARIPEVEYLYNSDMVDEARKRINSLKARKISLGVVTKY